MLTKEERIRYAGIYLLKLMDLKPEDGGVDLPAVLPSHLSALDEVVQQLMVEDRVEINRRKETYAITKEGFGYLDRLIAEAVGYIEDFDGEDVDAADVVTAARERHLDPFRVRFLWGWYEGEFDDLVAFQESRGIRPVEQEWATFLTDKAFFENLALDVDGTPGVS